MHFYRPNQEALTYIVALDAILSGEHLEQVWKATVNISFVAISEKIKRRAGKGHH